MITFSNLGLKIMSVKFLWVENYLERSSSKFQSSYDIFNNICVNHLNNFMSLLMFLFILICTLCIILCLSFFSEITFYFVLIQGLKEWHFEWHTTRRVNLHTHTSWHRVVSPPFRGFHVDQSRPELHLPAPAVCVLRLQSRSPNGAHCVVSV